MQLCSVCQQANQPGYRLCSRCGAHVNRSEPPLLVIQAALAKEAIWGISLAGILLPLILLGIGMIAAWQIWEGVGIHSYWSITGLVAMLPGAIFTLSILPLFRRVRSGLVALAAVTMLGMVAAGIIGLFVGIYFFYDSVE